MVMVMFLQGRGSDEIGSELAATLARSVAAGADGKGDMLYSRRKVSPGHNASDADLCCSAPYVAIFSP